MRLKELTVQGYKSFATKTRFEFPPGVTAIVGPNGSGKSNIADAVRWALGEQRPTQLRARRTDDLIFSGTERRPRSGLAEVRLVLDNADGWLPVDYAEVEVTRRAHRDGSNEYAVNGAAVRLRDVLDLLGGRLGQSTYTVIGQGLVDSSLALRPDERRGLIDEAAGILPLQRRRDASLRRLEETDVNLTRVRDVLAELTPRLRRMERLAERAERHDELAGSLVGDLEVWYGFQWRQVRSNAAAARDEVAVQSGLAATALESVTARELALRAAEAEADRLMAALGERRREREELARLASTAHEEAAVARARLEGMAERLVESAAGFESDVVQHAELTDRLAVLEAELEHIAADVQLRESEAAETRNRLGEAEESRRVLANAWESARRAAMDAEARESDAKRRLDELRTSLAAGIEASTGAAADRESRAAALAEADATVATTALEAAEAAATLELAEAAESNAARAREAAADALRAARDAHAEATARQGALAARMRALRALLSGAGEGGVQARVEATAEGLVGRLAQAVMVEPGWEAAAGVALGNALLGVLLRDDRAVDQVLASLPPDVDGQVTLIPARGRAGAGPTWSPQQGERMATEVVTCPAAPDAIATLLGGVAFVESVEAARSAVSRSAGPAAAATQGGRLLFRTGVVVAGAPAGEILAQERERRSLADLHGAAEAEEAERAGAVDAAEAQLDQADKGLVEATRLRGEAEAHSRQCRSTAHEARAHADRQRGELQWADQAASRRTTELEGVATRITDLETELSVAAQTAADAAAREDIARAAMEAHQTGLARAEAERAAEAARDATTQAAVRQAEADAVRRQLVAIGVAGENRRQRDEALILERTQLEAEAARLASEDDRLAGALEAHVRGLAPEEEAASAAVLALRGDASGIDDLRTAAHTAEARLADARLAAAKAESRFERVLEQLAADADMMPSVQILGDVTDLGAAAELPLPVVDELPDGLESRIARIRSQLRDLGAIDAEALAAYRESADHHSLLTEQRADLAAAEADLREALATLETEMDGRFERTFNVVAEEFQISFPTLFGGGEARLAMDDETGGVEIYARPPGKRTQPLALLSGGERALTGVALVFALLKASQTPFVVLDEVDASLDEANVDRFRAALEDLATRTQVVIITHNRGTVQTADTVYGVSMGEDGASQTLSLSVEQVVRG